MAELPDTYCRAFPLSKCGDIDIDKSEQGTFYIKADFEFLWSVVEEEGDEEDINVEERKVELFLPRDLLLDESWGRLMLTDVLSATKVPARDHRLVTETILSCARSMARNYPDGQAGVLPMSVIISCCLEDGQELDAPVILGSIRDKYSIKGLRKVKVEGEAGRCSICLEDMPLGSVAASLSCSHVYHDHCVFTWLLESGTCPLCRSNT